MDNNGLLAQNDNDDALNKRLNERLQILQQMRSEPQPAYVPPPPVQIKKQLTKNEIEDLKYNPTKQPYIVTPPNDIPDNSIESQVLKPKYPLGINT